MRRSLLVCAVIVLASLAVLVAQRGETGRQVEWLYYGGTPGNQKYSPLTDINPSNIARLQKVWEWKHWETPLEEYGTIPGFFEATPLMIDGVLYVTTPYNSIAALDAETGRELWRYDGEAYKLGQVLSGSGYKLRGTAFWRDGNNLRLLLNSRSRLIMLDAKSGTPVPSFGNKGEILITDGLNRVGESKHYTQSSPPTIYKDLIIMGSQVPDRVQTSDPVGQVQAISARTGKRVWVFSVTPQNSTDPGAETWEGESWRTHGHGNVWAPMALDEARGLLYLPTTTPSSDFYGGNRPGANLFAESLVCLDANTGKIKWYFQAVHHGLWDWDFPAPPTLGTITVDGQRIDAVAQVSKQGFTYVFDRVTGKPVWPIVERPVPVETDVPGEKPFATQPFPTKPPPFIGQGVTLEDANNLTPEIKRLAQEQMKKFKLGPIFTPPSLIGTLQRPSAGGGANWGGAAFDPESGYLFVRGSHSLSVNRVAKNNGSDPLVKDDYSDRFARGGGGTPASLPGGLPLLSPPYNVLTAYDLNKGDIAWQAAVGEGSERIRNHPLLKGVTLPERLGGPTDRGGAMVTRSGLVFIGGGDKYFYAFDRKTGKEIWRAPVPYEETAVPMTYRTRAGRQFVVMATGQSSDNALVAFALSE
ncbi:MAG TPA: PQQ-binding-like beta-propeller repeat protein [Vicinamibacterales bacterium]|nr:PQQ-binding-like beta-propeller repeat protein [Vicinamibacterales bacterium]